MKIAFLTSSYPRYDGDGTAPFIKSIAEALAELGNTVEVIAPYDAAVKNNGTGKVKIHWFRYIWPDSLHTMGHGHSLEADVSVRLSAYLLLPFYILAMTSKLYHVVSDAKSDLIFANWVLPNGIPALVVASIKKLPLIIALHGSDIYVAKKNRIFAYFAKMVFSRAGGVIACSPDLLDRAKTIGMNAPYLLLPYGIDTERFSPVLNTPKNRENLGWGADEVIIYSIGRLVYKKGFEILINAMAEIILDMPQVKLVIGGEGPLENKLKEIAEKLKISKSVRFIGRVPWNKVPENLACSDIFILPSVRDAFGNIDGLPNVLIEAMSCGLPIIASDIGGVSLVIKNGKTGILVPSGNSDYLCKAIKQLISNIPLRSELGSSARIWTENHLTWASYAKQTISFIEQSLGTNERNINGPE